MIDPASYGVFLIAAFTLLVIPGPAVLYITARSIEQGRLAGILSTLGIGVGAFVHVVAAAFGISALLMSSALAFTIVKYLGAAYLIYLGISTLMSNPQIDATHEFKPQSLRKIFTQGIIVNVLNPKTALFFFAFVPQFINAEVGNVTFQILFLGATFIAMAICTDGIYAIFAGTVGNYLRGNQRFATVQKWFSGVIYIFLGILTALTSANTK
ncbi:MAG: LysE family translocator [Phototrophicaceae bacterium]